MSRARPARPPWMVRLGRAAAPLVVLLIVAPAALGRGAPHGVPHRVSARAAQGSSWSAPASLAGCATAGPVRVAFPAASPFAAGGPGAVLFGAQACGSPASPQGIAVSPVGGDDTPAAPVIAAALRQPAVAGLTDVAGAADGKLVVAAAGAGGGVLAEGPAAGPFGPASSLHGPGAPVAATSAYLGDVATASVRGRPGGAGATIVMHMQRHFADGLAPSQPVVRPAGRVTALAIGLDYRTDAIVAWQAGGGLFARWVQAGGRLGPVQRLAAADPAPVLAVTISDDDRAIVAWLDQPAGAARPATVYLDVSGPGVRFGAAKPIESFTEPAGPSLPAGAVRLTRLSRESVMLGWTGMSAGRYVVRAAPVSLNGLGQPDTISAGDGDSVLSALAPGPRDEALAVWTSAPRSGNGDDPGRVSILAARGTPATGGAARFSAPETVAAPGPNQPPDAAFDPASDRALAAWRWAGARPAVEYALRSAG